MLSLVKHELAFGFRFRDGSLFFERGWVSVREVGNSPKNV